MGFEVLTAVIMKLAIFWDIAPYSMYMSGRFGKTYHLHLQCRKSAEKETSENRRLVLAQPIFVPEDGGDTFLRNGGAYTYYTALYPSRCQISDYKMSAKQLGV
jgi:hypothetical protein